MAAKKVIASKKRRTKTVHTQSDRGIAISVSYSEFQLAVVCFALLSVLFAVLAAALYG